MGHSFSCKQNRVDSNINFKIKKFINKIKPESSLYDYDYDYIIEEYRNACKVEKANDLKVYNIQVEKSNDPKIYNTQVKNLDNITYEDLQELDNDPEFIENIVMELMKAKMLIDALVYEEMQNNSFINKLKVNVNKILKF